ncbi:hypothetical protein ACS0TY_002728 [Phlomoides rotata]
MNDLNLRALHFEGCIPVDCTGTNRDRSGGLCMLWRNHLNVSLVDYSSNHISLNIHDNEGRQQWQVIGLYVWPDHGQWHRTFQLLYRMAPPNGKSWMCMGEFNEIFWSWEKLEGSINKLGAWKNSGKQPQLWAFRIWVSAITTTLGRTGEREMLTSWFDLTELWLTLNGDSYLQDRGSYTSHASTQITP